MVRTISPDRQQLKAHAVTLRKMGWTERAIARELGIGNGTTHRYLLQSGIAGKTERSNGTLHNDKHKKMEHQPQFQTFLGTFLPAMMIRSARK